MGKIKTREGFEVEIDHNEIELTKEVEEYYDWLESTKCQCDEGFCETQDNCKGLYSKK